MPGTVRLAGEPDLAWFVPAEGVGHRHPREDAGIEPAPVAGVVAAVRRFGHGDRTPLGGEQECSGAGLGHTVLFGMHETGPRPVSDRLEGSGVRFPQGEDAAHLLHPI